MVGELNVCHIVEAYYRDYHRLIRCDIVEHCLVSKPTVYAARKIIHTGSVKNSTINSKDSVNRDVEVSAKIEIRFWRH